MIPESIDDYIKKLCQSGRTVEALALLRIEWRNPSELEVIYDQIKESMNELMDVINEEIMPVWVAWVEIVNQTFRITQ